MKKIYLLMMLLATVFVACSDDDDTEEDDSANIPELPAEKLDYWNITMNVTVEGMDNYKSLLIIKFDTEVDSVDWGLGEGFEKAACTPVLNKGYEIRRNYYETGNYIVKIKGHNSINKFYCNTGANFKAYTTYLDLSQCPTITELDCNQNKIASLEISKNSNLRILSCNINALKSLDISKCINLEELYCSDNLLTSLDVSKNPKLSKLVCSSIGLTNNHNKLSSLDVSNCTNLVYLNCSDLGLTSLTINNCTKLEQLYCSSNQLTSLDINECINLFELYCHDNKFTDSAMNSIYNSLPDRNTNETAGIIRLNRKDAQGNTTIALNKNWEIEY